ncbi:hypothetical protein AB9P05_14345 [Roseivirga sp. BDSF3-8]|uniref:hypothetical protein n=1 Tax=Roseivirga sp. BDSF3-8 TaxID=3241598 RepID=UPI0035323FA0
MADIFHKLKKLRESLGLKQSDVAACTSMSQRDISLLENGHKEFIPTSYLVFYTQIGIDVRWIFNGRPYEEDTAYLREFVKKLSLRNMSGQDLVALYKRKSDEGDTRQVAQAIVPLSEIYVIRAEISREYASNLNRASYLERQDRIQLPMAEAYRETFRCFQAESDRMAPHITAGDYLIGRLISIEDLAHHEGGLFIVISKDVIVGRLSEAKGVVSFVFTHPQYPPLKLRPEEVKELWLVRWRLTPQVSGSYTDYLGNIQRRLENIEQRLGD